MRKVFYFALLVLLVQATVFSQVPNSSFENWTLGNPDGWLTNNIPGFATPITETNSSHTGQLALKGEVESFMGTPYTPFIFSTDAEGLGFPVNQRYNSMKGYFKFNPVEGDRLIIIIGLTLNSETIGAGAYEISGTLNDYTEINIPIEYTVAGIPDTAIIFMTIAGPNDDDYHLGSAFYVDDLSLSDQILSVDDKNYSPFAFNLEQNYPNPFNPSTTISYNLPERSMVTLKIYNILGIEIAELTNDVMEAGYHSVEFDASSLPSGVYIYSISTDKFNASRKMTLLK